MILCGIVGKIGAVLSIIPEPVIGGWAVVAIGCLVSVGLSNIQHVNMASTRNVLVLGVSLLVGMMMPEWLKQHPGVIKTGQQIFSIISVTENNQTGTKHFRLKQMKCKIDRYNKGVLK